MNNSTITKIVPMGAPDTLISHDVTTRYLELTNYRYVDLVVYTSLGKTGSGDGVIKILAKKGESGEAKPIRFREKMPDGVTFVEVSDGVKNFEITSTDSKMFVFRVTTDDLIRGGFDRVAVHIPSVYLSDVKCSMVGILYAPRYSE